MFTDRSWTVLFTILSALKRNDNVNAKIKIEIQIT